MPTLSSSFPSILPSDPRPAPTLGAEANADPGAEAPSINASHDFAAVLEKSRPSAKPTKNTVGDRVESRTPKLKESSEPQGEDETDDAVADDNEPEAATAMSAEGVSQLNTQDQTLVSPIILPTPCAESVPGYASEGEISADGVEDAPLTSNDTSPVAVSQLRPMPFQLMGGSFNRVIDVARVATDPKGTESAVAIDSGSRVYRAAIQASDGLNSGTTAVAEIVSSLAADGQSALAGGDVLSGGAAKMAVGALVGDGLAVGEATINLDAEVGSLANGANWAVRHASSAASLDNGGVDFETTRAPELDHPTAAPDFRATGLESVDPKTASFVLTSGSGAGRRVASMVGESVPGVASGSGAVSTTAGDSKSTWAKLVGEVSSTTDVTTVIDKASGTSLPVDSESADLGSVFESTTEESLFPSARLQARRGALQSGNSAQANLAASVREGLPKDGRTALESSKKKTESAIENGVKGAMAGVGTFGARQVAAMSANTSNSSENSLLSGQMASMAAGSSDLIKTQIAEKTDANFKAAAAEAVNKIVELTEVAAASSKTSVEVSVPFGDEHVRVRIRFNEGQVQTTISSRSSDVRDALSREWQAIQPSLDVARVAFATPVFRVESSSGSASSNDASYDSGTGARQQSQQDSSGQPRSGFAGWQTGTSSRSTVSSGAVLPANSSTSLDTSRRLQVFA